jgi:hypothetical protein
MDDTAGYVCLSLIARLDIGFHFLNKRGLIIGGDVVASTAFCGCPHLGRSAGLSGGLGRRRLVILRVDGHHHGLRLGLRPPRQCCPPRHKILYLNRQISVYRFPRRALTLSPQLGMGIPPGARFPAQSADVLSATLYGHFNQAIYRNRPNIHELRT